VFEDIAGNFDITMLMLQGLKVTYGGSKELQFQFMCWTVIFYLQLKFHCY